MTNGLLEFTYNLKLDVKACYGLYKTDKDIPKYIKMHIDDGLALLNEEVNNRSNIDGFDDSIFNFPIDRINGKTN